MMKKTIPLVCSALVIALTAAGCGKSGKSSSQETTQGTTAPAVTAAEGETDTGDIEDSPAETAAGDSAQDSEAFEPGEKLGKVCGLFEGDYTYTVKTTFSDSPDEETAVTVARQGEKVCVTYADNGHKTPDRAYWFDGSRAYDADMGLGIYSGRDEWTDYNLILSLMDKSPEKTEAHFPQDVDGLTAEEYTYAGDTYITVFDFYFDKNDDLKKYTVVYSVEGEDDLVETCEIESIKASAEIKDDPLAGLTDFDSMTEDERLGFCQKVCGERGISTDDMYQMNITTDNLKRIDYDVFAELVYKYGSIAGPDESSRKEPEKKG